MMMGNSSSQGMINSLKANRLLLRKKRKERTFLNTKKENYQNAKGIVEPKKASEAVLKIIRKKALRAQKKQHFITIIILLILSPIFIFGLYKTIEAIQKDIEYAKVIPEKDLKKYLFFINDGDNWLQEKKWHNAIFQYKKALEIFPNEYDANYRLALAYTYRCKYESTNCNEGETLVNTLIKAFPDKINLNELKRNYK
ncbi:hypothetical protein GTQ40_04830 [Flavobacteriaceae bacterium R38]|nr:hypothetical protein [Flavobacteriaceae bacterium R38]